MQRRRFQGLHPPTLSSQGELRFIPRLLRSLMDSPHLPITDGGAWALREGSVKWSTPGNALKFPTSPVSLGVADWGTEESPGVDRLESILHEDVMNNTTRGPISVEDAWRSTHFSREVDDICMEGTTGYKIRDILGAKFGRPRPAYVSCCKRLYNHLSSLLSTAGGSASDQTTRPRILDMAAAYGARALAAWSLDMGYVGVDPDTSLASGHSKMLMMLPGPKTRPEFLYLPIEAFVPQQGAFDIVTLSPPPFTADKYNGSHQAHSTYKSLESFKEGFLTETVRRARIALRADGIFAFSCLDQKDVIYTEFMLLHTSQFLEFVQCVRVGECTPWWIFRKKGEEVSPARIPRAPLSPQEKLLLEIVSWLCIDFMTMTLLEEPKGRRQGKESSRVGRMLMGGLGNGKGIAGIPDSVPEWAIINLESEISGTYVQAEAVKEMSFLNGDHEIRTFGWSDAQLGEGITGLCKLMQRFLRHVVHLTSFEKASRCLKLVDGSPVVASGREAFFMTFIREDCLFGERFRPRMEKDGMILFPELSVEPSKYPLSTIRYDSLGCWGHQFTRPRDRTVALQQSLGMEDVIDGFASVFNNACEKFCSLFPDIEGGSLGVFADLKDIPEKTLIMLNPPPIAGLLKEIMVKVEELLRGHPTCVAVVGTSVRSGEELHEVLVKSPLFKCAYLLDSEKFPSKLPEGWKGRKPPAREEVKSVGVVFSVGDVDKEKVTAAMGGEWRL